MKKNPQTFKKQLCPNSSMTDDNSFILCIAITKWVRNPQVITDFPLLWSLKPPYLNNNNYVSGIKSYNLHCC